jgi:Rap1a immunity proteins
MRKLCFPALAAAMILATPASGAQPAGVIDSARTLAQACRSVEREIHAGGRKTKSVPADAVVCLGYMQAMQDLAVLSDENRQGALGSCPAVTTTLRQLIQAFLRYSRENPDHGEDNAAVAVIRSFQVAYPCPPTGQAAQASEPGLYPANRK